MNKKITPKLYEYVKVQSMKEIEKQLKIRMDNKKNGIDKPVIIIRYNPDKIHNNKKNIKIDNQTKLNKLIRTIKTELTNEYDNFIVKIIQLYYNDNYSEYMDIKSENITSIVTI